MKVQTGKRPSNDSPETRIKKVSLSLTEAIEDFANGRAKDDYDGNLSMYVRTLIKRDMVLNGRK